MRIAEWAADAIQILLAQTRTPASDLGFIAFPGQTVWHEPPTVTWQLGEPAILAERFGVRVVSNFRPRDVAAGGQGAPLVPMADVLLFAAADHPRVLLNLGGMANITYVPRRAQEEGVFAFDTGPGVAIIDRVAGLVDGRRSYDRDGLIAAKGKPDDAVLAELLGDPFFAAPPPKSTGRERFGDAYARELHARVPGADGVATAVELTARTRRATRWAAGCRATPKSWRAAVAVTIPDSWPRWPAASTGSRGNIRCDASTSCSSPATRRKRSPSRCSATSRLHGQPGNVPSATGASGSRVLGSVTPA